VHKEETTEAKGLAMSLDSFTQAFAATDWNTLAASAARQVAAARPAQHPVTASASASASVSTGGASHAPSSGLAAGDAPTKPASESDPSFLTFSDLLDAINPLQQIPIIDGLYRHYSGDTIRPQGSILGGLIYGGVIGGAIATAMVLVHEATGVDPEEEVIAYLTGDDAAGATTQTAAAQPAATKPATAVAAATPSPKLITVADANQAALHQLAADLAGGAQVASGPAGAPAAQTPTHPATPSPAPAQPPAPIKSANPLISGLPADGQPHPTRMPLWGAVQNNPNPPPPPAFAAARRFGNTQTVAMVAASPNRPPVGTPTASPAAPGPAGAGTDAAAAGAATGAAAGAPLAARTAPAVRSSRPPGVVLPTGTNRAMHQALPASPVTAMPGASTIKVPTAPEAPSVGALVPAKPITDPPPLPAEPLTPDAVSQVMMRNLDKYQALARAAARPAPPPTGTAPGPA
jgi:hypothetical protein